MTASVVLGVMITRNWSAAGIPRFVSGGLHRNISLLALVFLALHIVTSVLDSFAHLGIKDALIPFASRYRPIWLGLGVLAAELFVALVVTSLVRGSLGYQAWRLTHWLAYASWPLAVIHGLGTGSDTKQLWVLFINGVCIAAVLGAIAWRLFGGIGVLFRWRVAGSMLTMASTVAVLAWTFTGPLRPGWALAAGTPRDLLIRTQPSATATPTPAALPRGLSDQLSGQIRNLDDGGVRLDLVDQRDTALRIVLVTSDPQATAVTLSALRNGYTVCSGPATVTDQAVTASCGGTAVTILQLTQSGDNQVVGLMQTR
jgi:sulfoxide reductase heme-binding subunit YedZ